jgi:hypothetical protein
VFSLEDQRRNADTKTVRVIIYGSSIACHNRYLCRE